MRTRKCITTSAAALLFALCLTVICGFNSKAEDAKETTMAATDYLNVRSEPGTYGEILGVLSPGEGVQITGSTGEWYHVKYNGKSAYAYQRYLNFEGSSADGDVENGKETDMQSTVYLNVRTEPSLEAEIISLLSPEEKVQVTGKVNDWYKIKYNGNTRYVSARYLTFINGDSGSFEPRTMTTKVGVNFRKGPSTSTEIIGGFTEGTALKVVGEGPNGWYKIENNGVIGYVHSTNLR